MFKFNLLIVLFLFGFSQIYAQNKRDSSNAEIKQQAVEMREKLNKYLADNLLEEQIKKDTGVQVFFDSMSTMISKQQSEINRLKEQFEQLEKQLNQGTMNAGSPKQKQHKMVADMARGTSFHWVGDNQLNLYFPFDGSELSAEQQAELRILLKSQKGIRVKLNGYTDWVGGEKHNKKLASNRCLSAVKFCKEFKIPYKISSYTKCNTYEVYSDETAKWCRRVEIIIY
ncbi:MAG: OmpA family protein [Bacteroidota bacterium]|nr:OmpA family protein [Bacteroidota bacterium]